MFVYKALLISACIAIPLVTCDYGWNSSIYNDWGGRRNNSHNLILGRQGYGDRLLHHSFIYASRSLFRKVYRNVSYPHYGTSPFRITHIRVIDMKTDGTGGYPSLRRGGIGYYFTSIQLDSQRSHGLRFNVSIYGR